MKNLNQEIERLAVELARANTHLHFFNRLYENYEMFSKAKDFWNYTLSAHFGLTLVQIGRVYDSHGDGLNLFYILRRMEESVADTSNRQKLLYFQRMLDKKEPTLEKFRLWRNNVIAHLNRGVALADRQVFWEENPVLPNDCQKLINQGFEILKWCSCLLKQPRSFQEFAEGVDDYQIILNAIMKNELV